MHRTFLPFDKVAVRPNSCGLHILPGAGVLSGTAAKVVGSLGAASTGAGIEMKSAAIAAAISTVASRPWAGLAMAVPTDLEITTPGNGQFCRIFRIIEPPFSSLQTLHV